MSTEKIDADGVAAVEVDGRAAHPARSPLSTRGRDVIARTARNLEEFARDLPETERAALEALLDLAASSSPRSKLAAVPPQEALAADELEVYERLASEPMPASAPRFGSLVVVMKATRLCNLRCTYCHFWNSGPNQRMTFEVMARATRDAIWHQGGNAVDFVWHGGEVTLLEPSVFRKAIWLQERFRRPQQVLRNSLQTNGTRLTGEWLDVLSSYGFDVGVSLDGPPELHDQRRRDAAGRATSSAVREGIRRLGAAGINHGVLVVVDADMAAVAPQRLLEYLVELGVGEVAVLNVIPENTAAGEPPRGSYLPWPDYVGWLRELFAAWWGPYSDGLVIRELDDLVRKVRHEPGRACLFAGGCHGRFLTIEPGGDVSACDKYVGDPDFALGNILQTSLQDIINSSRLDAIRTANDVDLRPMRQCPWFDVCQGGCPHDRRLNERYRGDHDHGCCGLAPLLGDMAAAVGVRGHDGFTGQSSAAARRSPDVEPERRRYG